MPTDERAPRGDEEECRVALLSGDVKEEEWQVVEGGRSGGKLARRAWEESKKLWVIVGPAIFSRVVTYSMNVITQAFAGHLGDLELAAISIANTVVVGFNFGLMGPASPRKQGIRFSFFSSKKTRLRFLFLLEKTGMSMQVEHLLTKDDAILDYISCDAILRERERERELFFNELGAS